MRILLTGPTGFIGSNFLRLALARGHEVAALLYPGESLPALASPTDTLHSYVGTLAEAPWPAIQSFKPEACLHTAWVTAPGSYLESPDNDRFLEWSQIFAERFFQTGGGHLLALGSCAEYQPARTPLVEDQSPLSDTTRYARCKNALRLALENLAQRHGTRVGWGRVFYPYGPGEHPVRLCSSLIQQLARGEKVILKTPQSTKDYIYIDDLASAILTAIESGFPGTINFGTGRGVTVKEMAQTIAGIMGCPHLVEEAATPVCDPMSYMVADATKLRGLGWKPRTPLTKGLRRLREHGQSVSGR